MSALIFLTMNKIINTMKHFILITFILLFSFSTQAQDKKAKAFRSGNNESKKLCVIDFKYSLNNAKENINQDSKT
jgi:hypothetical protein